MSFYEAYIEFDVKMNEKWEIAIGSSDFTCVFYGGRIDFAVKHNEKQENALETSYFTCVFMRHT